MRNAWLNFILYLTTKIYKQKEKMVTASPLKTVLLGIYSVVLDIFLFLVAWPTYFMADVEMGEGIKESAIKIKKLIKKEEEKWPVDKLSKKEGAKEKDEEVAEEIETDVKKKKKEAKDEKMEDTQKEVLVDESDLDIKDIGDQEVVVKIKLKKLLSGVHKVCLGNNCYYRWHENIFSQLIHWAVLLIAALIVVFVLVYQFLIINTLYVSAEATAQLLPIADGTDDNGNWTDGTNPCIGTTCYTQVDDTTGVFCTNSDGDSTYIQSTSNGGRISFDINESGIPDGSTITQISITTCHKAVIGTGATFQARYCHNDSCTNSGTNITTGSNYVSGTQNIATSFTKTSGSDIEIGLITTSATNVRATKLSAVITYTPPVADTTPPDAVSDLTTSNPTETTIDLSWTAPGDDGDTGTADSYDIRYSTAAINDGNWGAATPVTGEPTPSIAGTAESMTVSGLTKETMYYFAMKTSDEVPNESALSNVSNISTIDTTPPSDIVDLLAAGASQTTINLYWTAPGDDADTGTAEYYDIRYSTSLIDAGNFNSATSVTGEPTPSSAGSSESMTVGGLTSGITYYFAIKTADNYDNLSGISNITSFATAAQVETTQTGSITLPPVLPLREPQGGFAVLINNGDDETTDRDVVLKLDGGLDVDTMGISNFEDMRDAVSEPYAPIKNWDICSRAGGSIKLDDCPEGEYAVYAQFYGDLGQKTGIVSDSILKVEVVSEKEDVEGEGEGVGEGVESPEEKPEEVEGAEVEETPPVVETEPTKPEEQVFEEIIQPIIKEVIPVRVIETPKIIEEVVEAIEEPTLKVPELRGIEREVTKNNINFSGFGEPGTEVVLFIHSEQFLIYTTKVDGSGVWAISHSQDKITLAPGKHTVYGLTLKEEGGIRSKAVELQSFEVDINYLALILRYFDLPTTILTLFVALLSFIFFSFKRREK